MNFVAVDDDRCWSKTSTERVCRARAIALWAGLSLTRPHHPLARMRAAVRKSLRLATQVHVEAVPKAASKNKKRKLSDSSDLDSYAKAAQRTRAHVVKAEVDLAVPTSNDAGPSTPSPDTTKPKRKKQPVKVEELDPADFPRSKNEWKFGAHVSSAGGVENVVYNAARIGCAPVLPFILICNLTVIASVEHQPSPSSSSLSASGLRCRSQMIPCGCSRRGWMRLGTMRDMYSHTEVI